MKKVLGNKWAIGIYVIPGLLLYTGFLIVPVIWSFYYTVFDGSPGIKWEFCGLDNYIKLFSDTQFFQSLVVNCKYILIVMAGQIILGLTLALMFHFWLRRCKSLVRTIVFFPVVLPVVAVAQLFTKIYEVQPHYGLLNSILSSLGLDQLVQAWLGQQGTALGALSVMDIWTSIGFYAIIFYGALLDVSNDVVEAARIDGAKSFQLFRYILLPLIRPIMIVCLVFSFTGTVKMFESALALTGGGPSGATKSLSLYMYDVAFTYSKVGYASVVALVIFLLCVIGSFVIKKFDKDVTA
ncbi:MAG: carbohydrate ABC transporter permease [Lachnospiraceae bacterium]